MNELAIKAVEDNNIELLTALLEKGANIDFILSDKNTLSPETLLSEASKRGHVEIVKILVEHGANLNMICDMGPIMALFSPVIEGYTEVAKILIEAGADVNEASPYNGVTALHCAAKKGHTEIVKLLVDAGAEIDARLDNDTNCTPLYEAAINKHTDIVEYLVTMGAKLPNIESVDLPGNIQELFEKASVTDILVYNEDYLLQPERTHKYTENSSDKVYNELFFNQKPDNEFQFINNDVEEIGASYTEQENIIF
jgi:ankyrin repeat protein